MAVDENTVKRIAFLARLKVENDKLQATKDEFNKILNWVEELNEINTDDVEPLISVNEQVLRLREDVVDDGNQREAILKNAPSAEFDYFAVPKVVE